MVAATRPLAPNSSGRGSGMCSTSSPSSSSYLPVHIKRRSSFSVPLCASFGFLPSRSLIYNVTERKERSFSCCSRVELTDEVVSSEKERSEARLANGDADIINNVVSQEMIERDLQREQKSALAWLYPDKEELPDDKEMSIFDHLEELRQRVFISVVAVGVAILGCFSYSKTLVSILEAPAFSHGVRFLQLSPGEYFFTTVKVSGYCGILVGSPVILYEIIAFVLPGLTRKERRFLAPIIFGSSILFYSGLLFSYAVLTPAALNFFVEYSEGVVESLWSIDRYFEFILVLMFGTGLSFQVPVIQLMLGQTRIVTGDQMLSIWRFVVLGAVIAAAVITPSTDPLTQVLLAGPLIGLYLGGALLVKFLQPKDSD